MTEEALRGGRYNPIPPAARPPPLDGGGVVKTAVRIVLGPDRECSLVTAYIIEVIHNYLTMRLERGFRGMFPVIDIAIALHGKN